MQRPHYQKERDEQIGAALRELSDLEGHRKSIDGLLSKIQERFERDYTKIAVSVGALMVIGGFVLIILTDQFSFALTAMVWGAIIQCFGLYIHRRLADAQVAYGNTLINLEVERAKCACRQIMLDHFIANGGDAEQLRVLLGESGLNVEAQPKRRREKHTVE